MKNIHQQFIRDYSRSFIGIPYDELDCYGLVRLFYNEILGIRLEELYQQRPTEQETSCIVSTEKEKFLEVASPEFGDIILFNVAGITCHIGVYINEIVFLHTRKHTNSVFEKMSNWKKRVKGYYRCQKS